MILANVMQEITKTNDLLNYYSDKIWRLCRRLEDEIINKEELKKEANYYIEERKRLNKRLAELEISRKQAINEAIRYLEDNPNDSYLEIGLKRYPLK